MQQSPLQWPSGWPRNQYPEYSRFTAGSVFAEAREVEHQLELLGATGVVINSNMQYKPDGTPYARQQRMADTGVAVYFTLDGEQQCIPCDKWITLEENLRAIHKTIEALRGIERWGAKEMMNAAFRGFKALPASGTAANRPAWHEVLEVSPSASPEVIRAAYKQKALKTHPDRGGTAQQFQEVRDAFNEASQ